MTTSKYYKTRGKGAGKQCVGKARMDEPTAMRHYVQHGVNPQVCLYICDVCQHIHIGKRRLHASAATASVSR